MPWLLTDYGAEFFVNRATGKWETTGPPNKFRLQLLGAAPPLDRSRVLISQYTILGMVDPDRFALNSTDCSLAEIVGGRAVAQWGPPAYVFTALAGVTVYGIIVHDGDTKVFWFDRFNTPVALLPTQTIQILPAIRATSECPPLGGCS